MCDGDCNIPFDEILLYFEKQLIPIDLGPLRFSKDFKADSIALRFDLHRRNDGAAFVCVTLWYKDNIKGFYGTPSELKSGDRLCNVLRENLKATEQEIKPVVALWENEIVPLMVRSTSPSDTPDSSS